MRLKHNLKTWKEVAKPNTVVWIFQIVFSCLPQVCLVLSALPNAKAISALSISDFESAKMYIFQSFILAVLYALFFHAQYRFDTLQLKCIYPRIQKQIFEKVFLAKEQNFNENSKEKMINIISNDIAELSDFCDFLSLKIASFFKAVTLLIILFSLQLYIGLIILSSAIFLYFILTLISMAIAKSTNKIYALRDNLAENFSDIVSNRNFGSDFALKPKLEEKYSLKVNSIVKTYGKRTFLKSARDNGVYFCFSAIIFLCSILLTKDIENNIISITNYLVILPYISNCISSVIDFFGIFSNIENVTISALRVKTLLLMNEKDMASFGKNTLLASLDSLVFTNVSFLDSSTALPELKTFSCEIDKKEIVQFYGIKNCGKRTIFHMLRRAIRPKTGTITISAINIFDFTQETFIKYVSYVCSKPSFYIDTIYENLKMVNPNRKSIFNACKLVGIHNKILTLKNGYQTSITAEPTALSNFEKYMLSFARALLTNSKFLIVYEFPIGLSEEETNKIKTLLKQLKKEKTIIIFSASQEFFPLCNKIFGVENGKVKTLKTSALKTKIKVDSAFSK